MQLLAPAGLLLLSLIGLVLIYHSLRPRYKEERVPSLLLWRQVQEALSSHVRWRRLVRSLLLLVHLLVVALLALALADPVLPSSGRVAFYAVIVDHSASMTANDIFPSRLAAARAEAAAWLRERAGRFVVVQAGPSPAVVYQGDDPERAASAVLSIEPVSGGTDWQSVANLLAVLEPAPTSVHVWTDGVTDAAAFAALASAWEGRLSAHLVGADHAPNVGITAFEARPSGAAPGRYQTLLVVENFGADAAQVQLTLRTGAGEHAVHSFELAPFAAQRFVAELAIPPGAVVEAALTTADAFAADDRAYIVAAPAQRTRVAIVGAAGRYLEQGLGIFPHVDYDRRVLVGADEPYHLVIYHRLEGGVHPGTVLEIAPPTGPAVEAPVIVWWDTTHPLTRYIDWHTVQIRQAVPLPVGSGVRVLVDSTAGPLLTVEENGASRRIRLGFALSDSDFPFRVAFPVFLSNLLQYAHPDGWERLLAPAALGVRYELPEYLRPALAAGDVRVVDPSGHELAVYEEQGRYYVVPPLSGVYTVRTADGAWSFVTALPPRDEAALRRTVAVPAAAAPAEETAVLRPLWRLLTACVIALLFVEAWLYTHRGRRPGAAPFGARARRPAPAKGGARP